jgi:SPP1 gp7 family putative phage head morphogenesis protein
MVSIYQTAEKVNTFLCQNLQGAAMNDLQYQKALQEALAPKFRGRTEVASKVVPQYPHSVEREYKRFMRDYMAKCDEVIRSYMPELKRSLGYYGSARFDEVPRTPDKILAEAQREVERKLLSYNAHKQLERIASLSQKLSVAEWNRVIQRTLGISIFEDYYKGDFFSQVIDTWVTDNVNLITTQPKNILGRMREIVQQGQADGRRVEAIAQDINEAYGAGQRHARLIARDQTAKLNSAITRKQQKDAGVRMYGWDTSGDQRVRESHRKMNGLYCRYDDVTVYSDDGGKTWKKKTLDMPNIKGKFLHPGEDYQCRCRARAVFTIEGLPKIPVKAVDWDHVDNYITYRDKDGNTVTESRDVFFGKGGKKK